MKQDGTLVHIAAGGASGAVARTCVAPIERVKIIYQIDRSGGQRGYRHILPNIFKEEGFFGFWRGNSAAVLRVIPYMSCQFGFLEYYKSLLTKYGFCESNVKLKSFFAGSAAGVTAVCITYPLDVVRARMAMQLQGIKRAKYSGFFECLIGLPRDKGASYLYRGLGATMCGVAPYAGIKFFIYDVLKPMIPAGMGGPVTAGACAGIIAQTFVYPFDVIRRRHQTHDAVKELYSSTFHALKDIYQKEGVTRGLYRGLSLNYIKTAPNTALYLSLYDVFKDSMSSSAHDARDGE